MPETGPHRWEMPRTRCSPLIVFVPMLRRYRANPVFAAERLHRSRAGKGQEILSWLCFGASLLGSLTTCALRAFSNSSDAEAAGVFAALPAVLLVALGTPIWSATLLAQERDRGTLMGLILTPYNRREIVLGMLGARVEPMARLCLLCLPTFLLTAVSLCVGERIESIAFILGTALFFWLLLAAAFQLAATAGAYAAVRHARLAESIGLTYVLVFLLPLGTCLGCSVATLIVYAVAWHFLLDGAVKGFMNLEA